MKPTLKALAEARDHRWVWGAAGLAVVASIVSLAIPWVVGQGAAAMQDQTPVLWKSLLAIVGLLAVRLVLEFASTLTAGRERYRLAASLRADWHRRVLALPPGGEADEHRQDWISILSYDIPRITEVLVDVPIALVQATITLIGSLLLMAAIHPLLTALVFVTAPVAYLVARSAVRVMRSRAERYWDLEVSAMAQAEEGFVSRWAVQTFGQQERFTARFNATALAASAAGLSHVRLLAFIGPLIQFLTFVGMVVIVWLASTGFGASLSEAELLTFVLYGLLLSSPLRALADSWSSWQEVDATLGRLERVNDFAKPVPSGTRTLDVVAGHLTIEDVTFGWRAHDLFRSARLEVAAGERIALIGDNGVGKSTLVALLLGFAEPSSGCILVDGVDLADLTVQSRRALFAVVPQHAAIFGGTIRENIAFGRPNATDAEIFEALDVACGRDFVAELPLGLQTRVGDAGLQMSGGQRQRIAIARALLTRAPILVLDEATAGFDVASSASFAKNLATLPNRTVIWITHEEEPQRAAGRVVRVQDGNFVGCNPPA